MMSDVTVRVPFDGLIRNRSV